IGRGGDADIILEDTGVSRHHLELRTEPDATLVATDLGSTNGTFVDGERIRTPVALQDRSLLKIGRTRRTGLLPPAGPATWGAPDERTDAGRTAPGLRAGAVDLRDHRGAGDAQRPLRHHGGHPLQPRPPPRAAPRLGTARGRRRRRPRTAAHGPRGHAGRDGGHGRSAARHLAVPGLHPDPHRARTRVHPGARRRLRLQPACPRLPAGRRVDGGGSGLDQRHPGVRPPDRGRRPLPPRRPGADRPHRDRTETRSAMSIALRYAARSDVGLVRSNNQDSGYAGSHLLVVADGMGGQAGGDVASSVAIGRLAQLDSETPASAIVATREASVLEGKQATRPRARDEPQLRGLGTTITARLRAEGKFALAHIGDSRAYLLRDGETTQVTKDHTFVQRLLDEGRLTEEEAERHPQRSVLMRVLGDVDADPELDLSLRPAHPGDRWMLCSDGLSGLVSLGTIDAALTDFTDPGECAEELIQLALKGGGPDNITCIVADVVDLSTLPRSEEAPSTAPQIVGSAARDRHAPTAASG